MKSSREDLENRGFLEEGAEKEYRNLSTTAQLELLESKVPKERTLGARLLSQEKGFVADRLIGALKVETKLYTKIELCNALVIHKGDSVALLVNELGKIGTNQHVCVPEKEFGKDSYPLPRDIAARTLASIGKPALPELLRVLESNNMNQISEAIDAIGFICFYEKQAPVFETLKRCYLKHTQNDLIRWKLIRAMSGFIESSPFLTEEFANCQNARMKKEINRSLKLIRKRENKPGRNK